MPQMGACFIARLHTQESRHQAKHGHASGTVRSCLIIGIGSGRGVHKSLPTDQPKHCLSCVAAVSDVAQKADVAKSTTAELCDSYRTIMRGCLMCDACCECDVHAVVDNMLGQSL